MRRRVVLLPPPLWPMMTRRSRGATVEIQVLEDHLLAKGKADVGHLNQGWALISRRAEGCRLALAVRGGDWLCARQS